MSLAERMLDRQRALVVEHPQRGIAIVVGGVGILPGDDLEVRLSKETFALACGDRVLVSPARTSDESMAILRGVPTLTVLQQPADGTAREFPGVRVVQGARPA